MKKLFLLFLIGSQKLCGFAQTGNVGIGTTTPGFPLNFASTLGDKVSLYGNTGNHYGFGIQNGLLQIHSDAAAANIAFGFGSSDAFTERARIINSGTDGMSLNGRLLLKNGSLPLDVNQTPGVWLYKADNSGLLGFMGTQNNQNIGFYGGPANGGWGFTYDAINSRVGIGTSTPTSSLNVNGQITVDQKNFGGYGGLLLKGNVPGNNYPNIAFSIKNTAASPTDVVAAMVQGDLVNNAAGAESIDLTFLTSKNGLGGLSERLRITNNGNVGIGKSAPTSTLDVNGSLSVKVINNLESFGNSAISAVIIGDAYYVTLVPRVQDAYYQIPSAASCPGRMMILKRQYVFLNFSSNYAYIVSPGSQFTEISYAANGYSSSLILGGFRYSSTVDPLDAVQLISDGTSWNWWEIKK
jgi:hypothetical protein